MCRHRSLRRRGQNSRKKDQGRVVSWEQSGEYFQTIRTNYTISKTALSSEILLFRILENNSMDFSILNIPQKINVDSQETP